MAKAKKIAVLEDREWVVSGQLTFDGISFFVTAKSKDEAIEKAASAQWDEYDLRGASTSDCRVQASTIRENT